MQAAGSDVGGQARSRADTAARAASQCSGDGRRGRGRVRSAKRARCRCAGGGPRSEGGRGLSCEAGRRGSRPSTLGTGWVLEGGAEGAASVSQTGAHSRKASEQHWAHYRGMQVGGQRKGRRGPRREFRCGEVKT